MRLMFFEEVSKRSLSAWYRPTASYSAGYRAATASAGRPQPDGRNGQPIWVYFCVCPAEAIRFRAVSLLTARDAISSGG